MKTTKVSALKLTFILGALTMVVGILKATEPAAADSSSQATAVTPSPATATATTNVTTPVVSTGPSLAPDINLSPAAAAIARLAQGGLGDQVMLAYINNSTSAFNLGTEQIIYLNDLGVSGDVVKAMIQRDASLNADAQAAAQATATAMNPPPPTAPDPASTGPGANNPPTSAPDDATASVPPPDMGDTVDYAAPNDADYFYSSLAPYGSWDYVAGMGLCWQPAVCLNNPAWQPYCDRGRWLYTDCGWYWQSDYSWGWAPFHYGRWFHYGNGWAWHPEHTWAPAWVSWRKSEEYCGWAPLPPSARFFAGRFFFNNHAVAAGFDFGLRAEHYTFIPVARMSDYAPTRYQVASWQTEDVFHRTAVINHFALQNNRVVNHGINPDEVSVLAHTPIRHVEIRDLSHEINPGIQGDHLGKADGRFVMYRPQLPAPTAAHVGGAVLPVPVAHTYPAHNNQVNANGYQQRNWPTPSQHTSSPLYYTGHSAPSAPAEPYPNGSMVVIGNRTGNTVAAGIARGGSRATYQTDDPSGGGRGNGAYRVYDTSRNDSHPVQQQQQPAQYPNQSAYIVGARYTAAQKMNEFYGNGSQNHTESVRQENVNVMQHPQEHFEHVEHNQYHAPVEQHSYPAPVYHSPAPAPSSSSSSSSSGSTPGKH